MSKKLHGPPTGKWKKAEKAEKLREAERERVREIYHNKRKVEIIPASIDIKKDNSNIKRVAAYCRVSTLEDAQAGSTGRGSMPQNITSAVFGKRNCRKVLQL